MSSSGSAAQPATLTALDEARPRRPGRRAATVERLTRAAVDEIRAEGYDGLTVRNVARRAGVAPATAYIHFTSKDHLVAETFWRLLRALPPPELDGAGSSPQDRVAAAIADIAQLVTDEPAVTAAATTAVLANQPDVAQLRRRIGASFRERFAAALGDEADERVLDVLDLAFSGALVRAGVGEMSYADLGSTMAAVAEVTIGRD
jgi:AcrR family transcriptional regulator